MAPQNGFEFMVYDPPKAGYPYMAIGFAFQNGTVVNTYAVPYRTYAEADAGIEDVAKRLSDLVGGTPPQQGPL